MTPNEHLSLAKEFILVQPGLASCFRYSQIKHSLSAAGVTLLRHFGLYYAEHKELKVKGQLRSTYDLLRFIS